MVKQGFYLAQEKVATDYQTVLSYSTKRRAIKIGMEYIEVNPFYILIDWSRTTQ